MKSLAIGLMSRVFTKIPGGQGFNPRSSHTKDSKNCTWCRLAKHYDSRIKWRNPGNEVAPTLYLGVVAIEKVAFGLTSTKVANFFIVSNGIHTNKTTSKSRERIKFIVILKFKKLPYSSKNRRLSLNLQEKNNFLSSSFLFCSRGSQWKLKKMKWKRNTQTLLEKAFFLIVVHEGEGDTNCC